MSPLSSWSVADLAASGNPKVFPGDSGWRMGAAADAGLPERERVSGDARGEAQRQRMVLLAGLCDERVETLAVDRDGGDRATVDERVDRTRPVACGAQHQVDVLGLGVQGEMGRASWRD